MYRRGKIRVFCLIIATTLIWRKKICDFLLNKWHGYGWIWHEYGMDMCGYGMNMAGYGMNVAWMWYGYGWIWHEFGMNFC